MASISFDGSELNRFVASMRDVPDDVLARVVLATRKVGADVKRDAMTFAPVDTGNLRGSIGYETTISADAVEAEIGPTAEYGHWVEDGTSRMAPQAYMGPAFDRNEFYYQQALAQTFDGI